MASKAIIQHLGLAAGGVLELQRRENRINSKLSSLGPCRELRESRPSVAVTLYLMWYLVSLGYIKTG